MAVIDFHSHILPGIDDGSKGEEQSLKMMRMSAQQGVHVMVATPHFYAGSTTLEDFLRKRREAVDRLRRCDLPPLPYVVAGAEVAFFAGIGQADGIERLCIPGTNLMLLEMPFVPWSERNLYEVELLLNRGIQPIIAHLERFYSFQTRRSAIDRLLEMPVYIQINGGSLLHWQKRARSLNLFREGYAHLLGSDCHDLDERAPNLGAARELLKRKLGRQSLGEMDALGEKLLTPAYRAL